MDSFQAAGELVTALFMILFSVTWPPAAPGAFWMLVGVWGFVSILFDDEISRGTPGIDLNAYRAATEEKFQKQIKQP